MRDSATKRREPPSGRIGVDHRARERGMSVARSAIHHSSRTPDAAGSFGSARSLN